MTKTEQSQKTLLLDIECTPNLSFTWGKYEQDVIEFAKEWYLLSFSVKWLDSSKVEVFTLADFPGFNKSKDSDKELCEKLWSYIDKADLIIAHNGDRFDLKKINARFAVNGLLPPSPYKTIDTLKIAKKHFAFNSNKLNDLGVTLGLGKKAETGGFQLWKDCMSGDRKAYKRMAIYNRQDVVLLEKIYLKLRPFSSNHPSVLRDSSHKCMMCSSANVQYRGYNFSKMGKSKRWQCLDCGGWSSAGYEKK
jgi:DNA polymerase III epsilon subunit-like protein